MNNIHKTAIIEDGAKLGDNITIGAYTVIGKNVKIGNGTTIGSHTLIEGKTTIGEKNEIFSHATIGSIPQDLKFSGEDVELIIGNSNKIREYTLFNPGTKGGGSITKIGDNNLFMGYTHVAHDVMVGNNCIFANVATLAGHVEIADNVVVGGLTPIHQFCKVGSNVMIAGGSVLTQDIPPFCLAEGNRAVLRGLNLTGLRRRFKNREDIDEIKRAYKAIFESGNAIADVAKELLETNNNKYVHELADFVISTKRGIPFNRK
ncbi:acyl-ACP--UDP-N-acetylglucosamine O-acyltransferase [Halarcobacter anaerophilus]|jgi:UDP-N-acetylglucosamine acyltransferase|uniref:Acyl-[acyl-carrier-protein]--UDP-N-acetylglucosamine O-acyltransferase n=1 Tax=Halarcobacter anaerophilus TaxID=877500 RepID=A0A4Q0XUY5_9BACT|nr:acyl-ACP--UDP-N-acetylglucosamine O-acyltransferase [Halarcobacter anaerophilus]QDF30287.1 UDP-N-acetylglucosamine acyltransferase [Halarcobacter anaerophilus]RXJ61222.1 acyl-[acyl-carrier-protein]--UDP-N-acetylglucosamine O-acyltransferase [Halarcobacter anaerophilus]